MWALPAQVRILPFTARFTFKPTISQSSPQKEPSFDPNKYPKPVEYFAAYERYLIAKREWQKQTGTFVTYTTHQNQPSKRRPRRPELPRRKKRDEILVPPPEQSLEMNTAAHLKTAEDREVDDSLAHSADKENLDNVLTELLACSPDELDGDAGVELLEKRLNIKPIDKQMLSLPEFPDVRRIELKARILPKPRTALSNIQNLLKGFINSENDADINEETEKCDNLAEYASKEDARMESFTVPYEIIPYQQVILPTYESLKSPNTTREQYNTMDVSNDTDTARGLQVEIAQQEEAHNTSPKQTNTRRKRVSRDSNMIKRSKTVHGESERDEQTKTLSHESGAQKQNERKSNEIKEKKQMKTLTLEAKMFSRRKSLAAAGTKWENGVRRSTRIKSRPLEYGRGERFLYGRINESLPTVVGI
ncbi:hypothetical protein Bca4012_055651 [Brassica carinata]